VILKCTKGKRKKKNTHKERKKERKEGAFFIRGRGEGKGIN
jgi:hypothetical protein